MLKEMVVILRNRRNFTSMSNQYLSIRAHKARWFYWLWELYLSYQFFSSIPDFNETILPSRDEQATLRNAVQRLELLLMLMVLLLINAHQSLFSIIIPKQPRITTCKPKQHQISQIQRRQYRPQYIILTEYSKLTVVEIPYLHLILLTYRYENSITFHLLDIGDRLLMNRNPWIDHSRLWVVQFLIEFFNWQEDDGTFAQAHDDEVVD